MTRQLLAGLLVLAGVVSAQQPVDPHNTYVRLICAVPMIGQGTPADPRRPQYAPARPAQTRARTDIIAFSQLSSDDGRFALVEFVARDWSAFQTIRNDKTALCFQKGKDQRANIEAAFKPLRRDFDLDKFGTVMP